MVSHTKEQQCRLTTKAEKTLEVRAKAYGSRLSKGSYVTGLEKKSTVKSRSSGESLELASPSIA